MDFTSQSKEFGQSRIKFATNCRNQDDWDKWAQPKNDFIFKWGNCWNNTIEYKVSDYEADVGFYIDLLGFDCNSLSENYSMVMGPQKEFFLSFRKDEGNPTPADAITIEFMIDNLEEAVEGLKKRGVPFQQDITQEDANYPMFTAVFKTPAGIRIKLWNFKRLS